MTNTQHATNRPTLAESLEKRILLLDGAMGSLIQTYGLKEEDFRKGLDLSPTQKLRGNNDLLSLTRPDVIAAIHRRYLEAGADIICTNTFSSQRISQSEYGCEHLVQQLNTEAVHIARQEAEAFSTPECPRYVIASMGPTSKSLSISPDVNDPAFRAIQYDELCAAYTEQIEALIMAGVDGLLIETVFDTLNAKAALNAAMQVMDRTGTQVPLLLSATVNDQAGRLLSGQKLEALLASTAHIPLLSIGLNCSFGAADMLPSLRELARIAPCYISAHPNAGLPNAMGQYEQDACMMGDQMEDFVREGLVNIIGGCCGTTPEHIAKLKALTEKYPPRPRRSKKEVPYSLQLSGLEVLTLQTDEKRLIRVGERCNVAGSRKFLRLIKEKSYEEALDIARKQVEDGAEVLDINMDDGLLDAKTELTHFLLRIGSEPSICKVPLMIDSSKWEVIREALKCVQGKCIVNSIHLKEGEETFITRATEAKALGAAVVVMAFDEKGQADTIERRIAVCQRAYNILVEKVQMDPHDIIFDPNILAVATGIPAHDAYAWDFIQTTRWIKENLPHAHVSGGVSNLSFSFRGNNYIRETLHTVFLHHAQQAGMDMAIVNPSVKWTYESIPLAHREILERVVLDPCSEATEALIQLATTLQATELEKKQSKATDTPKVQIVKSVEERLKEAVIQGQLTHLKEDIEEAIQRHPQVMELIEGPLMEGMGEVGKLFGEGKMFLPQVVKSARIMKEACEYLSPYMEAGRDQKRRVGKALLATVKGDVHDIGKNIVGVIMSCNGFEIIDLGVMVEAETIVQEALKHHPDVIGLSGLITPSLEEMIHVVNCLKEAGIEVPVLIGGATTSALHTALKIAPVYNGPVIWVKDASQNVPMVMPHLNIHTAASAQETLKQEQEILRQQHTTKPLSSIEEARARKLNLEW